MKIAETRLDHEFPDSAVLHRNKDGILKRVTSSDGELLWGYQDEPGDAPVQPVSAVPGEVPVPKPFVLAEHRSHVSQLRQGKDGVRCYQCKAFYAGATLSATAEKPAKSPSRKAAQTSVDRTALLSSLREEIDRVEKQLKERKELRDALLVVISLVEEEKHA